MIHRDIKPENVVLEGGKWDGRIYLIDFGGVQGSSGLGEQQVQEQDNCSSSSGTSAATCQRPLLLLLLRCPAYVCHVLHGPSQWAVLRRCPVVRCVTGWTLSLHQL